MSRYREELQEQREHLKHKLNTMLPDSPQEQELQTQLQEIEQKLQRLAAFPPAPEPDPLRDAYLRRVLKTTSRLELSGIDRKATGTDANSCLNLEAVYTALLTLSSEHKETLLASLPREEGLETGQLSRDDSGAIFQRADPLFRGSLVPAYCGCPQHGP